MRIVVAALVVLALFAAPALAQGLTQGQTREQTTENPMPNREYYDGVTDPRFSTAETAKLNDQIESYDARYAELEAQLDEVGTSVYEKDARKALRDEMDQTSDRLTRAVEDLIETHHEVIMAVPVEGEKEARLELLKDKRDALEILSDYSSERLAYDASMNEVIPASLESVTAEIERLEKEPTNNEATNEGGVGAAPAGSAPTPQEDDSSTTNSSGINALPLFLLAALASFVAWRLGWLSGLLGSFFGRPLASHPEGPGGHGEDGGFTPRMPPPPPPGPGPPPPTRDPEPELSRADQEPENGGTKTHPTDLLDDEPMPDLDDDEEDSRGGGGPGPRLNEEPPERESSADQENRHQSPLESPLETYSRDLTTAALLGRLNPVIGRDRETLRVIRTLSRTTQNNPVLIGEAGVGKTAIAEGLAQRIAAGDVPASLREKSVLELDLGALDAGTAMRGDFEARLKGLIDEAAGRDDVILFCDELHRLMYAGAHSGAGSPGAQALKPALARGELSLVGATTTDEFGEIEKDPAMERRFQPIKVEPLGVEDTIEVLAALRRKIGAGEIIITDAALEAAARLTDRYIHDKHLPDKAITVLDEAGAAMRTSTSGISGNDDHDNMLTAAHVAAVVEEITGIKVGDPDGADLDTLAGLETNLGRRVKGQDSALQTISEMIRRKRVGLVDETKPISAMFFGPTGTGKTELAKALAEELFGDERAMIRLDMSEYGDWHMATRLVGAPPGYVGHDEGGQLTEPVRRKPYSVVLMDEIEKADPKVLDILLQVLDDGRLTDSKGRTISFREVVLILTTNAGGGDLLADLARHRHSRPVGFVGQDAEHAEVLGDEDKIEGEIEDEIEDGIKWALIGAGMRPEFVNRLGAICPFRPLELKQVEEIARTMLSATADRLAVRGVTLRYEGKAVSSLAASGYSPEHGVRHLTQLVGRTVDAKISSMIYDGELPAGSVAAVVVRDGVVTVELAG